MSKNTQNKIYSLSAVGSVLCEMLVTLLLYFASIPRTHFRLLFRVLKLQLAIILIFIKNPLYRLDNERLFRFSLFRTLFIRNGFSDKKISKFYEIFVQLKSMQKIKDDKTIKQNMSS